MTSERSSAYRRLTNLLEAFGSDLLPEEQDQIRTAADALLFCEALDTDPEASRALRVASDLVVRRVVSGSALGDVADRLLIELVACGPESPGFAHAA
jgi:hypothetical protein